MKDTYPTEIIVVDHDGTEHIIKLPSSEQLINTMRELKEITRRLKIDSIIDETV